MRHRWLVSILLQINHLCVTKAFTIPKSNGHFAGTTHSSTLTCASGVTASVKRYGVLPCSTSPSKLKAKTYVPVNGLQQLIGALIPSFAGLVLYDADLGSRTGNAGATNKPILG